MYQSIFKTLGYYYVRQKGQTSFSSSSSNWRYRSPEPTRISFRSHRIVLLFKRWRWSLTMTRTMILKKKKDKADSPGFTMFLLSPGAPKTSTSRQLHQIEEYKSPSRISIHHTVLSCADDDPDDDDGDQTDDDDN